MAKYEITFSIVGSGSIELETDDKDAAEEQPYRMDLQALLKHVSFDDGLDVIEISEDE